VEDKDRSEHSRARSVFITDIQVQFIPRGHKYNPNQNFLMGKQSSGITAKVPYKVSQPLQNEYVQRRPLASLRAKRVPGDYTI
jgi:hypothetical protein